MKCILHKIEKENAKKGQKKQKKVMRRVLELLEKKTKNDQWKLLRKENFV